MRVVGLLVLLWCSAVARAEVPPSALACLAGHYGLRSVYEQNAWHLELPSGARVPYDDGAAKTFAQMLDAPDVQDTLALHYEPGQLTPVMNVDFDPGRVRVERLFAEVYGRREDLVTVKWFGQSVRVHKRVLVPLQQVEASLQPALTQTPALWKYVRPLGGGYNARRIAGTARTSAHAYGIAIDLNVRFANYWQWDKPTARRWRNQLPEVIVDAFEAAGFIWGGRWYHYDTMHFEYRPELLDPACHLTN